MFLEELNPHARATIQRAMDISGLTFDQVVDMLHNNPDRLSLVRGFGPKTILYLKEMIPAQKVVVTRHPSLKDLLLEQGEIDSNTIVLEHASEQDVKGRHVIGVLPLRLASLAASITEATLEIPLELRGKELSLEELKMCFVGLTTYQVSLK